MCSTSPVRTPKRQLTAGVVTNQTNQTVNWRMLDHPKKGYPTSKGKGEAPARWQEE